MKPRTLILIDEVVGSGEAHSINLRFHAPHKEDISIESHRARITRPYGTLTIFTAAPHEYKAEIKKRALGLLEFGSVYRKESFLKTRGFLQLTAALEGDSTTFVNILSTDTELMAALETEVSVDHAAVTAGDITYLVNTSGTKRYAVDSIITDALVYTEKTNGYSAMRVTELVLSGKIMLKSDAPICVNYTDSDTIIIRYSASIETKTTFNTLQGNHVPSNKKN